MRKLIHSKTTVNNSTKPPVHKLRKSKTVDKKIQPMMADDKRRLRPGGGITTQ